MNWKYLTSKNNNLLGKFEIIVINDKSKDKTTEKALEFTTFPNSQGE